MDKLKHTGKTRKHRDEKKEKELLTLIIKMKILFAWVITTSAAWASVSIKF